MGDDTDTVQGMEGLGVTGEVSGTHEGSSSQVLPLA